MQNIDKYSVFVRLLHWLMVVLFAVIIVVGFVMVEFEDAKPWELFGLHKSLGVLVFGLVFLRLFARATSTAPPLPASTPLIVQWVAHGTVILMYLCMIAMPITGYMFSNIAGYKVEFFGVVLPTLFAKNPELAEKIGDLHGTGGWVFVGLIGLHILGVIIHHVRGFEVLRRIT